MTDQPLPPTSFDAFSLSPGVAADEAARLAAASSSELSRPIADPDLANLGAAGGER